MTREELVALLKLHRERRDRQLDALVGCTCGDLRISMASPAMDQYVLHLADVVLQQDQAVVHVVHGMPVGAWGCRKCGHNHLGTYVPEYVGRCMEDVYDRRGGGPGTAKPDERCGCLERLPTREPGEPS